MKDLKDRYHEFKIACEILQTNASQKAKEWDVSPTAVMYAAKGANRSPRLRKLISQTIKQAQEVVPFSYPSNGQTNGQVENSEKRESEAA
ncbi:hypothetical protein [Gracilimonas tropica]|uniref:hypothetical protein n=1 Tax=Gracilimonas tropica TaxID=454600 RepID=UPI000378EFD4|nr:hypothetical protein [Gracilimonas tropica]